MLTINKTAEIARRTNECQGAVAVGRAALGICRAPITHEVQGKHYGTVVPCCVQHARNLLRWPWWSLKSGPAL